MKAVEIKEKCPRAYSNLFKFLRDQIANSSYITDENFIEYMTSEDNLSKQIEIAIESSPRSLFDFFDSEGIYIRIEINETPTVKFSWNLSLLDNFDHYNTRKEAESKAVKEAFLTLERKLSED